MSLMPVLLAVFSNEKYTILGKENLESCTECFLMP